VRALVCQPILTLWLLVRLMCSTREVALSRLECRAGKAASMVLVVVAAIVVVVRRWS
jgi:hypothetical protein